MAINEMEVTLPINEAVVWGTYSGGSTYTATENIAISLDIPFIMFQDIPAVPEQGT